MADWRRHLPLTWSLAWSLVWSLVLATLMLGPALAPGYVLSYDMVWVPDLALRPDFWGLGSGLPRAVPSDAASATVAMSLIIASSEIFSTSQSDSPFPRWSKRTTATAPSYLG